MTCVKRLGHGTSGRGDGINKEITYLLTTYPCHFWLFFQCEKQGKNKDLSEFSSWGIN